MRQLDDTLGTKWRLHISKYSSGFGKRPGQNLGEDKWKILIRPIFLNVSPFPVLSKHVMHILWPYYASSEIEERIYESWFTSRDTQNALIEYAMYYSP